MSMAAKKVMTATPTKTSLKKKVILSDLKKKVILKPKSVQSKKATSANAIVKKTPLRTVVTLKKSPEPKNLKIPIINNVVKSSQKAPPIKSKSLSPKKSSVPSTFALPKPAIRSPFRFPMLTESKISKVAHVFGIAFISVGAILSLLNMPNADNLYSVLTSKHNTALVQDSTNQLRPSAQQNVFTDPHVFISENDTLVGVVPITVTVPSAIVVELILENVTSHMSIPLGASSRVDDSTWSYEWDTTKYLNEEYRVRVVVKNKNSSYDYLDSNVYIVENTLIKPQKPASLSGVALETATIEKPASATTSNTAIEPTTNTGTTPPVVTKEVVTAGDQSSTAVEPKVTQASVTESAQSTSVSENNIKITAVQSEKDNTILFRIFVKNADFVNMNARNKNTGVLHYLGHAENTGLDEWHLVWNPDVIPTGDYSIFPSVIISGITHEGSKLEIHVENTPVLTQTISDNALLPMILLQIQSVSPLSKAVSIQIKTSPVDLVEIFAVPKNALTNYFVGRAIGINNTDWSLVWDTTQIPNGEYSVFARVKSTYGFSDSERRSVKIVNEIVSSITDKQAKAIDLIKQANLELSKESDNIADAESAKGRSTQKTIYIKPVHVFMQELDVDGDLRDSISGLLTEYRSKLALLLEVLAQAKRKEDDNALNSAQIAIDDLKNSIINQLPEKIGNKDVIDAIKTYLMETTYALQELTLNNENIIKERLSNSVMNDSDKDGVSDYDEVYLYKTNPFAADTDGDGYIDSAEITLGYNPLDSTQETLMAYESPKDTGTLRDDLLSVDEVITLTKEEPSERPRALFSGTGLPNSFVTLYIYSTPVIVTVRTSPDGGWSYIFDKELEDGAHEVYVGMTDNAGNVVAKSSPFAFTKTAEAFTKSDSIAGALQAQKLEPSFFSSGNMLLVASISIVVLGLMLLLLGLYARSKKPYEQMMATA